ncbi:head-tail joining protein [Halomonas piscis]|uniref:head-tail joining protein n=1 Tax=Halomonas piscis TaxID=3031727 RepID=UPI00289C3BA0|nr:hypothetical protein [Halomonas piscis]
MAFSDHSRRLTQAVSIHLWDGLCQYNGTPGVVHQLEKDWEVMDDDQVAMRVTTICIMVKDVAKSRQGDQIITPGRTWTVQQVLEDDGHVRRLWVS